jgi:hypothetical protein
LLFATLDSFLRNLCGLVPIIGKIPNVKPVLCEAAQLRDMQARSVLGRPI